MLDEQTRRGFLCGAGAACLSAAGCASGRLSAGGVDGSKTVIMSDTHIALPKLKTVWGDQPDYQNALFARAVDEVLAMRPLPRRVVVLGDVSLWFGYTGDYENARPQVERLKAAGVDVYLAPGNHDHREPMTRIFPECAERSPVKGRIVSVVDLGTCDLFLLDSLQADPKGEGANNPVGGQIDPEQGEWLADAAAKAVRPFLVAAHHPPADLLYKGKPLLRMLSPQKFYSGFIYGHVHCWNTRWSGRQWGDPDITRTASVPSTGWWGDIGYTVMHTQKDRAVLTNRQYDFFVPGPLEKGRERPASWDALVAENDARTCSFIYQS